MSAAPTIVTKRLTIRPVTLADVDDMHLLYGNSEVMGLSNEPPWTRPRTVERVRVIATHWATRGCGRGHVSLNETGEFVGRVGLEYEQGLAEYELGYSLLPKWRGNGLASEAAGACLNYASTRLSVSRAVALIVPGNWRSVKVAERLGFVHDREMNSRAYGQYVGQSPWRP